MALLAETREADAFDSSGPVDATELRLNQVLRRVDWRFLLDTPTPAFSVCHGDAGLQEAVRAIAERMADGRAGAEDVPCDLAVAQDPNDALLRTLLSSLKPGGSCYVEWSSRLGIAAQNIRRRLQRAGFIDVVCYAPRPSLTSPRQLWLPLGIQAARRWHLRQTNGPALRTAARQIAWMAADWAPLILPICTIARKPADTFRSRDVPRTLDFQFELRCAIDAAVGQRVWSPWVLASHGEHSTNKIILFALAADGRVELIVKIPRVPAAADGVAREAFALRQLRLNCPDVGGVPQLLFSGTCAGIPVVAETALHGIPLTQVARVIDYRIVAQKAVEWQARLVHTPASLRDPRAEFLGPILSFIDGPLAAIAEPHFIRTTKAVVQQLGPLPVTYEHRDFSPWNILIAPDDELAVLDWESAEPRGLPALDLIYFLTYFAAAQSGPVTAERVCEVHRITLDRSTTIGSLTHEYLQQYLAQVGAPPSSLTALRLLCWIVHARSQYVRANGQSGVVAEEVLRASPFVALWNREARFASAAQV